MPYAISYDVPADEQTFRRVRDLIGDDRPDGLVVNVVVQVERGLRHIGVWDSEEQWRRFHDDRVEPAVHRVLADMGFTVMPPDPPVEELELVDVWIGEAHKSVS